MSDLFNSNEKRVRLLNPPSVGTDPLYDIKRIVSANSRSNTSNTKDHTSTSKSRYNYHPSTTVAKKVAIKRHDYEVQMRQKELKTNRAI